MTVEEAAERLGLSIRRVQQFCAQGRIGSWDELSRRYVIGKGELSRFKKLKRRSGNPTFCGSG